MLYISYNLNFKHYSCIFPNPEHNYHIFSKSRANSILLTSSSLFRLFLTLPSKSSELGWLKLVMVLALNKVKSLISWCIHYRKGHLYLV